MLRLAREKAVLNLGERVMVAVSGGPDSTALLSILAAIAPRLSLELRAAYYDHRLREEQAGRAERALVEEHTARLGVPLRVGRGDVRRHARRARLSLEDAAREMRYGFLADVAAEEGCSVVATGHTADDQVETVLLHLIRGSGLEGLAGMAPRSSIEGAAAGRDAPALARPLLALRRADTEAYWRAAGLACLEDETNLSTAFLRNRVRLELLPLLRQYNPRIDEAVLRLAEAVRHDVEFIQRSAQDALATASQGGPAARRPPRANGPVVLPRSALASLPESLRRHLVREAVRSLVGDLKDVHAAHIEAVLRGARRGPGHHLDLPRGLRLDVGYEEATLSLWRAADADSVKAPRVEEAGVLPETPLRVPGRLRWGPWSLRTEVGPPAGEPPADPAQAWLDADAIGGGLTVRSRRRGDRLQPLGMEGERKLQDVLVDARVRRSERDQVPLVCSPRGIAWVCGVRIAHWARVRPGTRRVVKLRAQRAP